ncbi:DciA family protein [Methylohalobius crimeensis]|uniref:DciA family protein n=1 Tax=Methylohalobius crimeensis TaxID=244365 RepID=UPI0003B4D842|nr:DciA family protein [Methylohalobius crimeensis]
MTIPNSPKPVSETVKRDRNLAALLARARLHERLLEKIRRSLPDSIGNHCPACVLRADGQLMLYAENAAWASRLRFYQVQLLPGVNELVPVTRIQVRVLLASEGQEKAPRPVTKPGPDAVSQLERAADASPDPQIQDSLQRLARTLRRAAEKP